MKGVLVAPNVATYGWGNYYTDGRRNNSLPHGLLSLATELNRCGHDVKIVDMRRHPNLSSASQEILSHDPVFVGCGAMTVDFGIAKDLFADIRSRSPKITTIMGGVHATVATEDAAKDPNADYILTGEGELTLTEMVESNFVGYGRITKGVPPDLDYLLPIDRELVDYRGGELMHGGGWNSRFPYVTVMVGRGCPFKCAFCWPVSDTMFSGVRQRSVEHLMWELAFLKRRYKPAFVDFIDDLFMLRREWVEQFLTEYPRVMGDVPFNIALRVDSIIRGEDQLARLKEIGLESVNCGFESGSDKELELMRKGNTAGDNREAGKILNKLGLKIIANVMFGFPGSTSEDVLATCKMLKEMNADYPSPAFFTPYPGCALHEKYKDLLLVKDYKELNRHATAPKLKGVDYTTINAILKEEGFR